LPNVIAFHRHALDIRAGEIEPADEKFCRAQLEAKMFNRWNTATRSGLLAR